MPATVTPVGAVNQPSEFDQLRQMAGQAAQAVGDILDQFSDQPPCAEQCECASEQGQPSEAEVKKAKGFLGNFINYLNNGAFKNDINATAQRYNVPPKKLANNFLEKCLGTVGDVLGVVISTAGNAAHTLVDVLSALAHGAVNVIVGVANALSRLVTMNRTCVAA